MCHDVAATGIFSRFGRHGNGSRLFRNRFRLAFQSDFPNLVDPANRNDFQLVLDSYPEFQSDPSRFPEE